MESNPSASQQVAEYATALDLCSELTRILDEELVEERILEICTMLFAPSQVICWVMQDGNLKTVLARPPSQHPPPLPEDAGLPGILPAGFTLRIPSGDQTIAILQVNGIVFPEHRDRYLSLALAIAGICGLAVSNARVHRKLEVSLDDLKKEYARSSQLSRDLGLKVRELNCLYDIARLVEVSATTEDLLASIARIMPASWQYPDQTCARIEVDGRAYTSPGFSESRLVQESPVVVRGIRHGKVEVFLAGDRDGPVFLDSETALLSAVAERIGRVLERKEAEEALSTLNRELEDRVLQRTAELNAEIVQRKAAEESVRASLHEKEILLRELHHRVKNNLQLIMSILSIQARKVADPALQLALSESRNRIRTISAIHEKLWTAQDLTRIDLAPLVRQIPSNLLSLYRIPQGTISVTMEIAPVRTDINTAIPLAIILNELFSNALKHAFPEGRHGAVVLDIHAKGETLVVRFSDDGIGMPGEFDWENADSVGLILITSLVQQLQGAMEREPGTGTCFRIRLPLHSMDGGTLRGTFNQVPE